VLESENLLDVQPIFACPAVLNDPVDQHCHFGNRRIHAVEQAQFKRQRDLLEPLRPVGLDLAVLALLRPSDDLRQPLTLDGRRNRS
jgi:hypothetical protein